MENEREKKVIADIQNAFAWMKDLINNFSFEKLLDGLVNFAKGLKNAFGDALAWVFETLSAIGSNIGAMILNPLIDGINSILNKIPEKVAEMIGFEGGIQIPRFETKAIPNYFDVIDRRVAERQANNNTQNNNITINMPGGTDSLTNITNAVETGINKANSISPALLVNGAQ